MQQTNQIAAVYSDFGKQLKAFTRRYACNDCKSPSIDTCICRDDEPNLTYDNVGLLDSEYNNKNNYFGNY
jgi:hypothetical protein